MPENKPFHTSFFNDATSIDGEHPLVTSMALMASTLEISNFLNKIIKDQDVIISTIRKGSWIIDDYLLKNGITCEHYPFYSESASEIVFSKKSKILIFDDSVKTGKSIINILKSLSKNHEITIGCIAINNNAINCIKNYMKKSDSLEFLRCFEKYEDYDTNENGRLVPGCQTFYYAYFMVPYLTNLSVNYNPDFTSLSIKLDKIPIHKLYETAENICNNLIDVPELKCSKKYQIISKTSNNIRLSIQLKYLEDSPNLYLDQQKLRISFSAYSNFCDLVITPTICPIIHENQSKMEDYLYTISKKYIDSNEKIICDIINKNGCVIRSKKRISKKSGHITYEAN